ncbi:MAG: hypothetical protein AB8B53_01335 [Flavobacteriales bacterium]
MRLWCVLLLALAYGLNGHAEGDLNLKVSFIEALTREPLLNSQVIITYSNQSKVFKTGKKNNSVDINIPLNHIYNMRCVKNGYASKNIEIDVTEIPEENVEGGFKVILDITLFPMRPEFDLSVLKEPIGKCAYEVEIDDLKWDMAHTEEYKSVLDKELKRVCNLYQKQYLRWKSKGDKSMSKIKYKQALKQYRKALNFSFENEDLTETYRKLKMKIRRYS